MSVCGVRTGHNKIFCVTTICKGQSAASMLVTICIDNWRDALKTSVRSEQELTGFERTKLSTHQTDGLNSFVNWRGR